MKSCVYVLFLALTLLLMINLPYQFFISVWANGLACILIDHLSASLSLPFSLPPFLLSLSLSPTDASTAEQVEEFMSESAIMLDFDHPNVLKLLGVCFDTEDNLPVIVLPLMANGDLKSYLQTKRKLHSNIVSSVEKERRKERKV